MYFQSSKFSGGFKNAFLQYPLCVEYLDHGEKQMTEGDVAAAEISRLDQIENVNNLLLTHSNQESK